MKVWCSSKLSKIHQVQTKALAVPLYMAKCMIWRSQFWHHESVRTYTIAVLGLHTSWVPTEPWYWKSRTEAKLPSFHHWYENRQSVGSHGLMMQFSITYKCVFILLHRCPGMYLTCWLICGPSSTHFKDLFKPIAKSKSSVLWNFPSLSSRKKNHFPLIFNGICAVASALDCRQVTLVTGTVNVWYLFRTEKVLSRTELPPFSSQRVRTALAGYIKVKQSTK